MSAFPKKVNIFTKIHEISKTLTFLYYLYLGHYWGQIWSWNCLPQTNGRRDNETCVLEILDRCSVVKTRLLQAKFQKSVKQIWVYIQDTVQGNQFSFLNTININLSCQISPHIVYFLSGGCKKMSVYKMSSAMQKNSLKVHCTNIM